MNEILHGDCLELMPSIPDESIDMILCDLPYGTTYCEFDGVLKNMDKYNKKSIVDLDLLWEQYERIIKQNGAIVLTASQPFTSVLVSSNYDLFKYSWIWQKNKGANHVAIKFQPIKTHEEVLVFSKAGVNTGASIPIKYNPQGVIWEVKTKIRKNNVKKEGSFKYNSLKSGDYIINGTNYPKSILTYDIPSGKERIHPTQKPVALFEYLILTYTNEGETVLDNCAGSFTTAIACINTNRNYICMEKDRNYFEIGKKRIENHQQQLKIF
jgi:site-specific DNA-methyltransferase (adenine-specific)